MERRNVIVAGGGPVGLLVALGLAQAGVEVTVLEEQPRVADSPRAMVYHWAVLAGLEKLGLLDEMLAQGFRKNDYRYKVFKTGEEISWTIDVLKGHVRHPYNVHLGQSRLAEMAVRRLSALPKASMLFGAQVTGVREDDAGVTVAVQTAQGVHELQGAWLVAADGARSRVRSGLGIGFEGMTWPKRFVATNLRADLESLGYARSVLLLDNVYGAVIAKIDNTHLWRCTYCEDSALDEQGVLERMPAMLAAILPEMKRYELAAYSPYRMHQRAASEFRRGRVLLAGDAAHSTNPTGALGLTSGLFDAYLLYEALAAVIQGQVSPNVLDSYALERRRVFLDVASPQASDNNRLVYYAGDRSPLEESLVKLRRLASDEAFRLERSLFSRNLETPSLVTGRRTNDL